MQFIDWIYITLSNYAYWVLYIALCIPLSFIMAIFLPLRYKGTWAYNVLFLFILSASIFIFGLPLALFFVLALHFLKPPKKELHLLKTADYPDYQSSPVKVTSNLGEGFAYMTVMENKIAKMVRQKMLVALNQFVSPNVNEVNHHALNDDVDEMRLYAQSLLEKQDRELSIKLKEYLHELEFARSTVEVALLKARIAEILWEQVYNYLIKNENLPSALNKIATYAKEALEVLTDNLEMPLLLVKIALKQNNLEEAKFYLEKARINGSVDYKVFSLEAEIAYREKRYADIKKLFHNQANQGLVGLEPVISFWNT